MPLALATRQRDAQAELSPSLPISSLEGLRTLALSCLKARTLRMPYTPTRTQSHLLCRVGYSRNHSPELLNSERVDVVTLGALARHNAPFLPA